MHSSFGVSRTYYGEGSPILLQVDYYGAPTPLKQIANLSAPESSLLVIQPYDKSSIQSIEKAIMSSDLNLTPNNDGNLIRINVPQLTAVRNGVLLRCYSHRKGLASRCDYTRVDLGPQTCYAATGFSCENITCRLHNRPCLLKKLRSVAEHQSLQCRRGGKTWQKWCQS